VVAAALEADAEGRLHEVAGMTEEEFNGLLPTRPDDVNRKETHMAEDATTTQGEQEPTGTEDQTVPYERFKAANERAKKLEQDMQALSARLEEREAAELSELEREKKAREKAEGQVSELDGKVKSLERGGWVRSAATKHGFNDPSDALAFTDLGTIEDEKSADRAVKSLAGSKPHLLKPADPTPPAIGRVLEGGQPVSGESGTGITQTAWDQKYGSAILGEIEKARAGTQAQ
jgi:hypothetical protein